MKCQLCNNDLLIASNKIQSPIATTEVTSTQTLVCVNPKCANYAGRDLTHPTKVAETISTKIN